MSIRSKIKELLFPQKEADPQAGYDLWSGTYDNQPENLMLALDEDVFSVLLKETVLTGKTIVDVGCGTGRHWKKILAQHHGRLIGYDVSKGMLEKLKEKFPTAEFFLANGYSLNDLENHSCDLLLSTLTIAHIEKIEEALNEWNRVLKPGGEIILTDYHPETLAKGGKRTFSYNGKVVALKNYIHSTARIRQLAKQLYFRELRFIEKRIDDSVKVFYEKQNAIPLFEQFKGTPIIYGIHLKKADDTA